MIRRLVLFPLLVAALPLQAQPPLGAEEFESYVTGKTLLFNLSGMTYGVEKYLRDRRVRWSFLNGECKEGRWYPQGDQICFEYEDGTGPQCWQFFLGAGGLRARFGGDPEGTQLYQAAPGSTQDMVCLGPEVGA